MENMEKTPQSSRKTYFLKNQIGKIVPTSSSAKEKETARFRGCNSFGAKTTM